MKKKLLSILLSIFVLIAIMPVVVISAESTTIGDIVNNVLPVVNNKSNLPNDVWTNSNDFKSFIYEGSLYFENTAGSTGFSISLSQSATINENHFTYSFNDDQINYCIDFYIENSNLISIEVSSSYSGYSDLIGTYIAPHIHGEGENAIVFKPWDGGTSHNSMPSNAGNYYLTSDIKLNSQWKPPHFDTTNLCLNGHVLTLGGSGNNNITLEGHINLNIYDCDTTTKHYFDVNANGLWSLTNVVTDNVLIGGIITGGNNNIGGAIYLNNQSNVVNIYGGTFVGNQTQSGTDFRSDGGAIYADVGSVINMFGGRIVGNTAVRDGGAIFLRPGASFNMFGGEICNNKAASKGGAVAVGDYYGSTETNNRLFTMTGGKISNNISGTNGGGVYIGEYAEFKVGGSAKITDNIVGTSNIDNVYLAAGKNLTIGTKTQTNDGNGILAPTEDMIVGITSGNTNGIGQFTSNGKENDTKYFVPDDSNLIIKHNSNHLELSNVTIADILPIDFPTKATLGWLKVGDSNNNRAYIDKNDSELIVGSANAPLNTVLLKDNDNYKCIVSGPSFTFNMDSNILKSITLNAMSSASGDYIPYEYEIEPKESKPKGYTGDLVFKTNGQYTNDSDVVVKVDGTTLTLNTDYTVEHRSIKVTLLGSYIKNLSPKTYTISIGVPGSYDEITSQFTITAAPSLDPTPRYKIPNTGVEGAYSNNHSLLKLSFLSLLAIGTCIVIKKKKDN